jgi:hypothetical protein
MPRLATALMAPMLAAMPAAAASSLTIDAEDHGNGRYRVQATVPGTTDLREAPGLLAPAFAQLCQGAPVTLGRYVFDAVEAIAGDAPKHLKLTQDVQCGDAPPLVHDSSDRPAPSALDEERVRAGMAAYLAARDAGDRTALAALYSSEIKRSSLTDDVIGAQTAFRRSAGAPTGTRLFDLDWQDDPAGLPGGRYVAVDYVVDYASGAQSCGYVGWRQLTPELYEIVHVEQGNLDAATLQGIAAGERDAVRRKMGCRE